MAGQYKQNEWEMYLIDYMIFNASWLMSFFNQNF